MSENPRRTHRFHLHREHFFRFIDPSASHGLEIGAHDLAMVEPYEGSCDFADFRTTEELISLAENLHGHNPEFVMPVKYDLRNGYESITQEYDWITAAHVIEHIPDLISWFEAIRRIIKPEGVLFLIVPDKNYTFDYHRRVSNLSDVVENHRSKLKVPSFAQVFDHHYFSYDSIDPGLIWAGASVPPPRKDHASSTEVATKALTGYEDAHCSVFTPTSFVTLLNDMSNAGLIRWKLVDLRSTQFNQLDFTAVFRPT